MDSPALQSYLNRKNRQLLYEEVDQIDHLTTLLQHDLAILLDEQRPFVDQMQTFRLLRFALSRECVQEILVFDEKLILLIISALKHCRNGRREEEQAMVSTQACGLLLSVWRYEVDSPLEQILIEFISSEFSFYSLSAVELAAIHQQYNTKLAKLHQLVLKSEAAPQFMMQVFPQHIQLLNDVSGLSTEPPEVDSESPFITESPWLGYQKMCHYCYCILCLDFIISLGETQPLPEFQQFWTEPLGEGIQGKGSA